MALCRSMNHKKNYHSVKKGSFSVILKKKLVTLKNKNPHFMRFSGQRLPVTEVTSQNPYIYKG